MLTQVEVFTRGVHVPPLSIVEQSAGMDLIQVTEVKGLEPVTATVSKTTYADIPGEKIKGVSQTGRNIVLSLRLNPDWTNYTPEDLRQILLKYFSTGNVVDLYFTSTHLPKMWITGVVESMDPNMFARDPAIQVSIFCEETNLTAVEPSIETGLTQGYSNPVPVMFENDGNVSCGFVLDIASDGSVVIPNNKTSFRVINQVNPYQLLLGSEVYIEKDISKFRLSTIRTDRYARNIYSSDTDFDNVLEVVNTSSRWVQLSENTNRFLVLTATPGLLWKLTYYAKFGGL